MFVTGARRRYVRAKSITTPAEGKLDAPALLDQPDPSTLIIAVATLERERAIAVACWTILALKQQKRSP